MPITIDTLASGDTDYIDKLNSNFSEIVDAITVLQSSISTGTTATVPFSFVKFMDGLSKDFVCIVGTGCGHSQSGTTITIAAGDFWLPLFQIVIELASGVILDLGALTAGTYYVVSDASGGLSISTSDTGNSLYSIVWAAPGFTTITRLAKVLDVTLT